MAIKTYRPITPSRRFYTNVDSSDITAKASVRSLLVKLPAHAGRNNNGRITSRHRQAGAKKLYRIVDFKRNKFDIPATVSAIEYDPYRNCRIALVTYADGEKKYILQPKDLIVGDIISSAESGLDIKPGNTMKLKNIPIGTLIHNIELKTGKGGQMCRAAGTSAQIMGRDGKYVSLRMPSSEMRLVLGECLATIGSVGNEEFGNIVIAKAGCQRHLGIRF
jgi:large subunit ribosomal protein L2